MSTGQYRAKSVSGFAGERVLQLNDDDDNFVINAVDDLYGSGYRIDDDANENHYDDESFNSLLFSAKA